MFWHLAVPAPSLSVLYCYTLCARNSVIFVIRAILAVTNQIIYIFQFVFPNPTLITANWMSSPHFILSWNSLVSPFKITEEEIYVTFRWDLWFALILNCAFCFSSNHYTTQFICCSICVTFSVFHFFPSLFGFSGTRRENGNFNWNSHFISFCQIAYNFISKKLIKPLAIVLQLKPFSHCITIEIEF